MTMTEYLEKLKVTEADYIKALGTTKKGHLIILKRNTDSIHTNNFNEEMLRAWNANMDIQLAHDPYAVVQYIVKYMTKAEDSMNQALKDALAAAKGKPFDEQLWALNKRYLDHKQRGVPEAIYGLNPGMHLRGSNLKVEFVHCGFPWERSFFYVGISEKEEVEEEK